MSVNLVKSIMEGLGGDAMSKITSLTGLGGGNAGGVMEKVMGTMLGGFAKKADSESGAEEVLGFLKENADAGIMDNLGEVLGAGSSGLMSSGGKMADFIFGNKLGGVTDALTGDLGLGAGIGSKLMSLAGPLLGGSILKQVVGNNLGAAGLMKLLGSQGGFLKGLIPSGITNLLGLGSLLGLGKAAVGAVGNTAKGAVNLAGNTAKGAANLAGDTAKGAADLATGTAKKGGNLIWKLLPLLLLLALAFLLWKMCLSGDKEGDDANGGTDTEQVDGTNNGGSSDGGSTDGGSTDGGSTDGGSTDGGSTDGSTDGATSMDGATSGSVTYSGTAGDMSSLLSGGGSDMSQVFNFGEVTADGKVLSAGAKAQFDMVANILKDNPNAEIVVRGHSREFKTGAENAGAKAECKGRAILVKEYIKRDGVEGKRISTKAIGKDEPLAGIDPTEKANKRISIQFTKM